MLNASHITTHILCELLALIGVDISVDEFENLEPEDRRRLFISARQVQWFGEIGHA